MTSKIATVTISKTSLIDPPAGVELGGFRYIMKLAGNVVSDPVIVPDETTPATFSITAPGDYTFECSRIAKSGEDIAAPAVSNVFTVAPDQVLIPLELSVSLADAAVVPAAVAVA